jgi:hypothetical protein
MIFQGIFENFPTDFQSSQQIYVKAILVLPLKMASCIKSLGLGPKMLEFKPKTLKFKKPKPYLNQGL